MGFRKMLLKLSSGMQDAMEREFGRFKYVTNIKFSAEALNTRPSMGSFISHCG